MTRQEIFDKCATHLLKQGFKCTFDKTNSTVRPGLYKRADGAACPVGILIPTNEYRYFKIAENFPIIPVDITLEYRSVGEIWRDNNNHLSETTRKMLYDNMGMLIDLQNLHDKIKPSSWSDELKKICRKWELQWNIT